MSSLLGFRTRRERARRAVGLSVTAAAALWSAAGCDQNMSDAPLPEASAAEVARLAERLSAAPSLSVPAGAVISGVIELAPGLGSRTSPADAVFLIARDPDGQGAPVSIERLVGNAYPMRFVIDVATGMAGGAAREEPVQLVVIVDRNGDGKFSADDLLGATPRAVAPGEAGVRVRVDATLGEATASAGGAGDAGARVAAESPRISGTVSLPPELQDRTTPSDVVFVIARRPGGGGRLVAVARLQGNRYPMNFALGERDLMLGGSWPETVEIEARVDADGDPLTRDDVALAGRAPRPVRPGQDRVEIVLGG